MSAAEELLKLKQLLSSAEAELRAAHAENLRLRCKNDKYLQADQVYHAYELEYDRQLLAISEVSELKADDAKVDADQLARLKQARDACIISLEEAKAENDRLDADYAANIKKISELRVKADPSGELSGKIHENVTANKKIQEKSKYFESIIASFNAIEAKQLTVTQLQEKVKLATEAAYIESLSDNAVLDAEIQKFNEEVFSYEDKKKAECFELFKTMEEFKGTFGYISNEAFLTECIEAIMDAESIQEMDFFRDSFLSALDDMTNLDESYSAADEIHSASTRENVDLSRIAAAIDAVNDSLSINDGATYNSNEKQFVGGGKLNDLQTLINHYPDRHNEERIKLEHEYHERATKKYKLQVELNRLQFLHKKLATISKFNSARQANKDNHALAGVLENNANLVLVEINEYQTKLKRYKQCVDTCRKNINSIYETRSSYLEPGYGFFETLKRFGKKDAVGEQVDIVKNLGEIVTAMPLSSSKGFSMGTLGFDIINYGAELSRFIFEAKIPTKLGDRAYNDKPSIGRRIALGLDKGLSLLLGLGGLVGSVLYCMTGFGFVLGGWKLLAASIVGLVDTAWGGGHFIHDTYHQMTHRNQMSNRVTSLEALHDTRLDAIRRSKPEAAPVAHKIPNSNAQMSSLMLAHSSSALAHSPSAPSLSQLEHKGHRAPSSPVSAPPILQQATGSDLYAVALLGGTHAAAGGSLTLFPAVAPQQDTSTHQAPAPGPAAAAGRTQ